MDFGEGGGVAPFEAPIGDVAHLEGEVGAEGVEQGALAHAAVAAEEDGAAGNKFFYLVDAGAFQCRDFKHRVADGAVEVG